MSGAAAVPPATALTGDPPVNEAVRPLVMNRVPAIDPSAPHPAPTKAEAVDSAIAAAFSRAPGNSSSTSERISASVEGSSSRA